MQAHASRVLVFSNYNAFMQRHMALNYDFAQVLCAVDDVDLNAPGPPPSRLRVEADRAASLLSRQLGLGARPHVIPTRVDHDYELFVFLVNWPRDAAELERVQGWRERCKVAVAVINEAWAVSLDEGAAQLKTLAQFDHVYTSVQDTVELFSERLRKPVKFLAGGVDTLAAAPYPTSLTRIYDVYAMGRTPVGLTEQLAAADAQGALSFLFDVNGYPFTISDFAAHRVLKTSLLKRTRYFAAYGVNAFANRKKTEAVNHDVIPYRFFEGTSAGCVLFGTAPECREYRDLFAWEDALIHCPPEHTDFLGFLLDLDAQPDRIAAIRARNVAQTLRRHDWCYRYEQILSDAGLAPSSKLTARKHLLAQSAQAIEAHGLPEPPQSRFRPSRT